MTGHSGIIGLAAALLAGAASAQTPPFEALATTVDQPLLIEGVARDAAGGLIVTSIHTGALSRVQADGILAAFGPSGGQGLFGVAADAERGWLWAASSPAVADQVEDSPATLLKLDQATGEVLATLSPPEGGRRGFGDVAVGPDGTAYVSDARTREILMARPDAEALTVLIDLPDETSPQGMVVSADGRWLVVADYRAGLHRIDLATGERIAVAAPEGVEMNGIDGLARHGDRIVGIQNGTKPQRVLLLTLNADWSAITERTALMEGPPLVEPTTGFVEGDALIFVARSQWPDFDREGKPRQPNPAGAVIGRLALPPLEPRP